MAGELHETDNVDGGAEEAVGVGQVQDGGAGGGPGLLGSAMTHEDLELIADLIGPQVVDLGSGERRPVVTHQAT